MYLFVFVLVHLVCWRILYYAFLYICVYANERHITGLLCSSVHPLVRLSVLPIARQSVCLRHTFTLFGYRFH